jgi:hypothetical protein
VYRDVAPGSIRARRRDVTGITSLRRRAKSHRANLNFWGFARICLVVTRRTAGRDARAYSPRQQQPDAAVAKLESSKPSS